MNPLFRHSFSLLRANNSTKLQWLTGRSEMTVLIRHKHWDPKFRKERARKFLKVDLPDFETIRNENKMSPEEMRSYLKEKGIVPPRPWNEKPMFISCTTNVFEPFIPPEGDGKASFLSKSGAKQLTERLGKKGKSFLAIRKIRSFDHEFDLPDLAEKCQKIYIDIHEALTRMDEDALHLLVTEKCFPELTLNTKLKTIRWKFLKSLEPPRVCHVRCTEIMSKENIFAQATIRMHTQQTLAVYDRFGRLMYGSEVLVKDVLEYVVFENHLANQYGDWRLHGKLIPDWMPPKEPISRTFIKTETPSVEEATLQQTNDIEKKDFEPSVVTT